ncbi:MAG TPA: NUDIX hydrolase [Acidimicrobiales bacterium]|jgi:ADP-ribose pyrophosphatase|nr:NUDIX hydrolase [Acidimicrobiales bacterium]
MGFQPLSEDHLCVTSLFTVARASFAAPDGRTFSRDIVHHPGAVVVVPVVDGGEAALVVRQFRAPVGRELLELPAGKCDVAGEPLEDTARRELAEEVGMTAREVLDLGEFYNSPGYCDELSHLYLARGLTPCGSSPQGVEEANMTIEKVRLAEVPDLVGRRAIVDAKTVLGLCLAREILAGGGGNRV